jgi:hypothetical protein
MTATSRFFPAPVFGENVLKKVSEVQVSDSAGDPENCDVRDDAKMSMLALRIVTDAVSVENTNLHIPNEFGLRREFKDFFAP